MPGRMEFDFRFSQPGARRPPRPGSGGPLRILVLGDFSGRQSRGLVESGSALSGRPIVSLDRDNFEAVLARLSPRLRLEGGDAVPPAAEIEFRRLEDFHPDALYDHLPVFKSLREIRAQLQEPANAGRVAAQFSGDTAGVGDGAEERGRISGPAGGAPSEDDRATLRRLLGRSPERPGLPRVDITPFLRRIVEPYIVPSADPRLPDLLAALDEATSDLMRALLHDRALQRLEAVWRSLWWLVTRLEMGEDLELHVLDLTKEEVDVEVRRAGADPEASPLLRLLGGCEPQSPGPWSLILGDYAFGPTPRDVELLGALGAVAARSGGPFLAAADPLILGCRSLADTPDPGDWNDRDGERTTAWQALRTSPVAAWVGLALPRALLRLPYGARTDPLERFAFEEMAHGAGHEALLWGNPAFACGLLIGMAFQEKGWSMQPGDLLDIGDLPAYVDEVGGDRRMTPCAEVFLTERAADAILGRGVMPLMSLRNTNAVRLVRFQSLADPPAAIAGPWR